jgi:hypothetical protein
MIVLCPYNADKYQFSHHQIKNDFEIQISKIKGMNPRASYGLNLNFDLPRRKQRGVK